MPQTPRTPTTAASHYFDDVFSGTSKPAKGGARRPGRMLRRSSTSRSIGNRSDWESTVNGDAESENDDANSAHGTVQNDQMEEHFSNYIADQLNRVRTNTTLGAYEDEFLTEADRRNGANGSNGTNGK